MGKRLARAFAVMGLLFAAVSLMTVAAPGTASASCAPAPVQGDWHNIDGGTRAMTRVVVETCQPVTVCSGGICTTKHDAGTFVTAFGKCSPTDCNWGRRQASTQHDDWLRTDYDFGFKRSAVWVKTYEYWGQTYLRVWVDNDFTPGDGRADYTTDEWFLR